MVCKGFGASLVLGLLLAQAEAEPRILVAGYLGTSITASGGGGLTILAVAGGTCLPDTVEVTVEGEGAGIFLVSPDGAVAWELPTVPIAPPVPLGRYLLGLVAKCADGSEMVWPELTSWEPTPTSTPTQTPTAAPSPTNTPIREFYLDESFPANEPLAGYKCCGDTAIWPDGNFVVVWQGEQMLRTFIFDAFVRRFNSVGTPLSSQVKVNTYTTGTQGTVSVETAENGGFVVVWESSNQAPFPSPLRDVYAQIFGPQGQPVGGEIQVNTSTIGEQKNAKVGVAGDGNFTVAWEDFDSNAAYADIKAQRFGKTGTPLGPDFLVNTGVYRTGLQLSPDISANASGQFVIIWRGTFDVQIAYRDFDIYANAYNSAGQSITSPVGPFLACDNTLGQQGPPTVSMSPDRQFTVGWSHQAPGASYFQEIYVRDFSSNGTPLGPGISLSVPNSSFSPEVGSPRIAEEANGNQFITINVTNMFNWSASGAFYRDRVGGMFWPFGFLTDTQADVFAVNIAGAGDQQYVVVYDDLNINLSLDGAVRAARVRFR